MSLSLFNKLRLINHFGDQNFEEKLNDIKISSLVEQTVLIHDELQQKVLKEKYTPIPMTVGKELKEIIRKCL